MTATMTRTSTRIYALLTLDSTACPETALLADAYADPEERLRMDVMAISDTTMEAPVPGTWTDVTDNEAIQDALGLYL